MDGEKSKILKKIELDRIRAEQILEISKMNEERAIQLKSI